MVRRRSASYDVRLGWLVAAIGVAVVCLAAYVVVADGGGSPNPTASPIPSVSQADEHQVVTDGGTVSFARDGDDLVVGLDTGSGSVELGRVRLPNLEVLASGETPAPAGTAVFVLSCAPPATAGIQRYVFGHFDVSDGRYQGPSAIGHIASDGLFLFALNTDAPTGPITIDTARGSTGLPPDIFESARTDGVRQPSGCFLLG